MAIFEYQYTELLEEIYYKEFLIKRKELNNRTGVGVYRIPHGVFHFDLEKEFPILRFKKVMWKSALDEILWIMQRQSNNIHDLKPHIWDEWADEEGSIGKAYGYQAAKEVTTPYKENFKSQVHYVLETLKKDPSDRRCIIDLWNVEDMSEMHLTPCCFNTIWTITDGRLNCLLTQRSADLLVGVPFNTTQYAMLTIMFARHLGVKPGQFTHIMADVHIYDYPDHIDGMKKLISMKNNYSFFSGDGDTEYINKLHDVMDSRPKFICKNNNTNFWDIKPEDYVVENYKDMGFMKFSVAV